jgi:hypothetical protein
MEIDTSLNAILHLFTRPDFDKALLLQLPDSSYVVEIYCHSAGKIVRERQPISGKTSRRFGSNWPTTAGSRKNGSISATGQKSTSSTPI